MTIGHRITESIVFSINPREIQGATKRLGPWKNSQKGVFAMGDKTPNKPPKKKKIVEKATAQSASVTEAKKPKKY